MTHRILVADDDSWILRMVTTVLEKRGYTVDVAEDGEDALEKAVASPPDLLITDVMMPGLDGWELVKLLRARPEFAFVPVIFLTALSSEDDRIRGFRLGADDYLPKPFRFEELDLRVAKTLRQREQLEQATRMQLEKQPTNRRPDTEGGLMGALGQVGLSALLVLLEMERKTGVLTVTHETEDGSDGTSGTLSMRNGSIVKARLVNAPEHLNEEAIFRMLSWSSGRFEFNQEPVEDEAEITTSTTGILMEGARRVDELAEAAFKAR